MIRDQRLTPAGRRRQLSENVSKTAPDNTRIELARPERGFAAFDRPRSSCGERCPPPPGVGPGWLSGVVVASVESVRPPSRARWARFGRRQWWSVPAVTCESSGYTSESILSTNADFAPFITGTSSWRVCSEKCASDGFT
jgi:hypothetical protein